MSVHVANMVWQYGPVSPKTRLLLLAIADHANREGVAWPGIPLLAQKCCCSERTVLRLLHELERDGWLAITRRSIGPGKKGNSYQIHLGKMAPDDLLSIGPTCIVASQDSFTCSSESADTVVSSEVTVGTARVTKPFESGDKTVPYIKKNHHEPSSQSSRGNRDADRPSYSPEHLRVRPEAIALLERLCVVPTQRAISNATDAIRLKAKSEKTGILEAARQIEEAASFALNRGELVNAFWFEDGKWRRHHPGPEATVGMYDIHMQPAAQVSREYTGTDAVDAPNSHRQCEAERVWSSVQESLRNQLPVGAYTTWIRPVRAIDLMDNTLVLQVPTSSFNGLDQRYNVKSLLPASITDIQWLVKNQQSA